MDDVAEYSHGPLDGAAIKKSDKIALDKSEILCIIIIIIIEG